MIKNILKKTLLASLLLYAPLMAESKDSESSSLIGIEIGSTTLDISDDTGTYDKNLGSTDIGLKIGAETDAYRLFLSYRYYASSDFDNLTTIGGELQYLINVANFMNIYLGVNGGVADIDFVDVDGYSRTVSQSYLGGDLGLNFHLGDNFDVELGARIMGIQVDHLLNSKTYTFGNLTTGYLGLIYKFKID